MKYVFILALVFFPAIPGHAQNSRAEDRSQAWKLLDESLREGYYEHRQQALAALATVGYPDPDVVKHVLAALQDKEPLVRCQAALALGDLKATSAIPDLKRALDDTPEVSFAAAKALTTMGDSSGRDILIAVLSGQRRDTPGMWTNAMREARKRLHHPEGLLLMGSQDAVGAMFGPASMVIPAIRDTTALQGKGTPGRAAAVAYLAKYPDPYAVNLLEWALKDDNQFIRLEAAKDLGDRGDSGSIPKLEALWLDNENIVRDMAAASILRILARDGQAGVVPPGPVDPPKITNK
ncbi:MAG TPA: HEAT repeat domain-containing protein [Bryobacteraceae bacterium]|nr:HEAT repeat domain-containing protein [Bryobacteraceae bacterium]